MQLRSVFSSLELKQGGQLIHQSHKNNIKPNSLNTFLRMSRNYDITNQNPGSTLIKTSVPDVQDTLIAGVIKLQEKISSTGDIK
jgi:hypothetical protein